MTTINQAMSMAGNSTMHERVGDIINKTLKHEGGYVNDPRDAGGETNFGISKRSYPTEDIKGLTKERAFAIYFSDYWIKPGVVNIKHTPLAAKVFDLGVNTGTRRAAIKLQQAINAVAGYSMVKTDGVIGLETLKALESLDGDEVLSAYINMYEKYYRALNQPHYLKGWLKRLHS